MKAAEVKKGVAGGQETETVTAAAVKKGAELELKVDSLAYGGRGVARVDNFVIFVKGAIPGQRVRATIYRKKAGFAKARTLEILTDSPHAVEPPCAHFPICGGCVLQQLDYSQQVDQKRRQVRDIFQRQAGQDGFQVDAVVGAENSYHYRNKMEFAFSNHRWVLPTEAPEAPRDFALGLHVAGRYDRIVDVDTCHLCPEIGSRILRRVRELAIQQGLKPYDIKTHNGFLRHLVLRFGINTGDLMINLVTAYENLDLLKPLGEALVAEFPEVTSLVNNIVTRKADLAFGEYENLLHGKPTIEERIGPLTFEISANSFFQTNTLQAEKLFQVILEGARLEGREVVYDLYSGTGSISLFLAREARQVYAFELISSAVEDATRNAVHNGIGNVRFKAVNLDRYFSSRRTIRQGAVPPPDVIVVDPPRAGINPPALQALPALKAQRIISVSCNPSTQARDAAVLWEHGYKLEKMTLVDMFPHTPHIETVAVFSKTT